MLWARGALVASGLVAVFMFLLAQAVADANRLELETRTPSLLVGRFFYQGQGNTGYGLPHELIFRARPSALELIDGATGADVFKSFNYGAFTRIITATDTEFLFSTDSSVAKPVLEITPTQGFALPATDASAPQPLDAHQATYEALAAQFSAEEVAAASRHMVAQMQALLHTRAAAALIHLSLALASEGISGVNYPSSLPLHLTAMRIAKLRRDVHIDHELLHQANAPFRNSTSQPEAGCQISNMCNNTCFGMCGPGCTCWEWVCGTCGCHIGCWQHDCCCSCKGMTSLCCLNLITFRCDGYANDCEPIRL